MWPWALLAGSSEGGLMANAFQEWFPLNSLALGNCSRYGDHPAVYALRDAKTGDILKFGETGCLRRRIFAEYLGGVGGRTTQRIHAALFRNNLVDHVEVAWLETKDKAEAHRKEGEFRNAYKRANARRPVWDRQG